MQIKIVLADHSEPPSPEDIQRLRQALLRLYEQCLELPGEDGGDPAVCQSPSRTDTDSGPNATIIHSDL